MNDSATIIADDLAKTFPGGIVAVDGLNLRIPAGSVYGLIGNNGAGKTTALRLITAQLRADRGTATVLGKDLWTADPAHRSRCAYVSQDQRVPHAWNAAQLDNYLRNFYPRWDNRFARELCQRWGVDWNRRLGAMSGGQSHKVGIVMALACQPDVLVLDEPAAGLDPVARRELIDELVELLNRTGGGCTILISSHLISDLERIADTIGIMAQGRLVMTGRTDDLKNTIKRVHMTFPGDRVPPDFRIPGAIRSRVSGPTLTALVQGVDERLLDILRQTSGARVWVASLGLEEIAIDILGPSAGTPKETISVGAAS